jgi:hypothetical protein
MAIFRTPSRTAPTQISDAASAPGEIDAFLRDAKAVADTAARPRLVFALDATMSRQPTWDRACQLQGEMFREAADLGGLSVQLVYFRGFDECRASRWAPDPRALAGMMSRIDCRGGHTQIRRVLAHVRKAAGREKIGALVFVGDAMEERLDDICQAAGELGLLGVPAFVFQEGHDRVAEGAFREIARLTKGAYGRLEPGAAGELGRLLRAAAAYASGGLAALERLSRTDAQARLMLAQMR